MHSQADIQRRAKAAALYRPARVKLLLVAEAPPCDTSRYFYYEDIPNHDWLYVYVAKGLFGEAAVPELRERKAEFLSAMRDAGVFMIDLAAGGMKDPTLPKLKPLVTEMLDRCKKLKPEAIVLIKSSVYDVAFEAMKGAELPVMDVRMPFPASGQQPAFLKGFARALALSGMHVPLKRPE